MGDVPYDLDEPYRIEDPLDMDDARRASRRVAEIRRDAEQAHRNAVKDKADKEAAYREAYAKEIVRLKGGGEASTTAAERARGEDAVRDELKAFRIAEGMVDAAKERLRGIEGERSLLKSLIDASAWMMRGPEAPTPSGPVYGTGSEGRRWVISTTPDGILDVEGPEPDGRVEVVPASEVEQGSGLTSDGRVTT